MARPKIKGLLYFPFDIDFFEDNKIRIVKARYRSDGVMIYLFLLCEIYRQGYYIKADEDFLYIISDELGIDQNKVKQVLNFLLNKSLFDNTLFSSDKVLTSEKLPEDESYILVSFENATMPDIARYEENDEGGTFYPGDDEKSYSSYGIFVNAWMPLPEPYKEEQ